MGASPYIGAAPRGESQPHRNRAGLQKIAPGRGSYNFRAADGIALSAAICITSSLVANDDDGGNYDDSTLHIRPAALIKGQPDASDMIEQRRVIDTILERKIDHPGQQQLVDLALHGQ